MEARDVGLTADEQEQRREPLAEEMHANEPRHDRYKDSGRSNCPCTSLFAHRPSDIRSHCLR